jgi:phospholipid/cholesterol/gamma-HCH transport system permease protein
VIADTWTTAREQLQLLAELLRVTQRSLLERGWLRDTLPAMYVLGNRSLFFLAAVMAFFGMIFVYQAGIQLSRIVPDMTQLGNNYLEVLVRELAPTICALMLATRVGAGIAAEIGSMVVTEQVDALRMTGTNPVDFLLRARFVASLFMTALLTILAGTVAVATGMLTAKTFFGVNELTFLDFSRVGGDDLIVGFAKCVAYGAAIPVASGHAGLSARGGSEGVGNATTRAVVNSSLWIIVLDFVLSALGMALPAT